MLLAAGVFLVLVLARNWGIWYFLTLNPSALGLDSLGVCLRDGLGPIFWASALIGGMWITGRALLTRFGPEVRRDPLAGCIALGLGVGAWGYGVFLLGLFGALMRIWLAAFALAVVAGAGAVLALSEPLEPMADGKALSDDPDAGQAWWKNALIGLLAYAAWNGLIRALAPPTDWDVLAYHLAIPKLYLRAGAIREIPWLLHSHWPHLMETLYAAPLAFGKDTVPALIHLAVCGAWAVAVFRLARPELGSRAAWLGAALAAAQPAALQLSGTAHSDGALAFFILLATACLWRWVNDGPRGWLVLGGIFAGLAASSKLLGLAPAALLGVWILFTERRESSRIALPSYAVYGLCAGAVVLPWYLKAALGAGNPAWPFLSELLGGSFGASAIEAVFVRSNLWPWPPEPSILLRYGPQFLLLPLAVLAFLNFGRGKPLPDFLKLLLIPAAMYFALTWRHNEGWRFMLPFYPALGLTIGWLAARLFKRRRESRRLGAVAAMAGLIPILMATQNNPLFAVLGVRSTGAPRRAPRDAYLERSLDSYSACAAANRMLRPGQKVLLFREIRGYYLDADYQWGDPVNQGLLIYRALDKPEDLARALRGHGVTHVLINRGLAMYAANPRYYEERTLQLMEDALARWGVEAVREGKVSLYELRL